MTKLNSSVKLLNVKTMRINGYNAQTRYKIKHNKTLFKQYSFAMCNIMNFTKTFKRKLKIKQTFGALRIWFYNSFEKRDDKHLFDLQLPSIVLVLTLRFVVLTFTHDSKKLYRAANVSINKLPTSKPQGCVGEAPQNLQKLKSAGCRPFNVKSYCSKTH